MPLQGRGDPRLEDGLQSSHSRIRPAIRGNRSLPFPQRAIGRNGFGHIVGTFIMFTEAKEGLTAEHLVTPINGDCPIDGFLFGFIKDQRGGHIHEPLDLDGKAVFRIPADRFASQLGQAKVREIAGFRVPELGEYLPIKEHGPISALLVQIRVAGAYQDVAGSRMGGMQVIELFIQPPRLFDHTQFCIGQRKRQQGTRMPFDFTGPRSKRRLVQRSGLLMAPLQGQRIGEPNRRGLLIPLIRRLPPQKIKVVCRLRPLSPQ